MHTPYRNRIQEPKYPHVETCSIANNYSRTYIHVEFETLSLGQFILNKIVLLSIPRFNTSPK